MTTVNAPTPLGVDFRDQSPASACHGASPTRS